jgi:hypothetical protein
VWCGWIDKVSKIEGNLHFELEFLKVHACMLVSVCICVRINVRMCVYTCRDRTMSVQEVPPSPLLEAAVRGIGGEIAKGQGV